MRSPMRTGCLVPVKGTGLIPPSFAWGYTGVPGLHLVRTLVMAVGMVRVLVRETFV